MVEKGLGDSIEKVLKATGIDKVAKKVLGDDCGCEERKKKLNKLFPYVRMMTADEIKIYEDIIPKLKGQIKAQDYKLLLKIYNKIFKTNQKPTSCGSCVRSILKKLEDIYNNSCIDEKPH